MKEPSLLLRISSENEKLIFQKLNKFWKTNILRNQDKETYDQENRTLHCIENGKAHEESDEKEVIDLCSESQTMTSDHRKGKPSKK